MPEENSAPDLFDLKFLPAWVKEAPNENRYADFAGEENLPPGMRERRDRRGGGGGERRGPRPARAKEGGGGRGPRERDRGERRPAGPRTAEPRRQEEPLTPLPPMEVRFVPVPRVLENVLAQIKAGHLAYSVFSLARMFLDKPERYRVHLKTEGAELFQLGEQGAVASDRRLLENGAFLNAKDDFYKTEVTQSEPIKGNFTSVARDRLSGTLLGPTNHHAYQAQLRALYEQRFSRRMSFPDYQRQIEMVNDPETVERWKEEARSVTTYITTQEEPPVTFTSGAETERHFRQTYLPKLIASNTELSLDGVHSRQLPDRSLGRLIEDVWSQEFRSPTRMMQELIGAFRQSALHVFRHRKGMLFVSPVRAKPFSQDVSALSSAVAAILALLKESPGINRKQLLENLPGEGGDEPEAVEKRKLALASNLHWLVREGHVIEFNDGALDLPRTKTPAPTPNPKKSANGTAAPAAQPNEPKETAPVAQAAAVKADVPATPAASEEVKDEPAAPETETPATDDVTAEPAADEPVEETAESAAPEQSDDAPIAQSETPVPEGESAEEKSPSAD